MSGLARHGSIWSSAKQLLSFTSISEVSGGVEDQELSSQDIVSARKRPEEMTVRDIIHKALDVCLIFLDLLYQQLKVSHKSVLKPHLGIHHCLGYMGDWLTHSFAESLLRILAVDTTFLKELLQFLSGEGFHLGKGVYSLKELDGALTVYGTKGIKCLWEILLEGAGKLVRELDFLLDDFISVLQEQAEFSYSLLWYLDASQASVMLSHIVSNELSISLIRLGFGWFPALPVAAYGSGVSQYHSVTPLNQEVHQPGAWVLQTNDTLLSVCLVFLDHLCEGTETIMVEVESVPGKHITV